tara:strand:- start:1811 stop:2269 length:459 start_codon:yes stop_codon:yes gene_type:complete
MFVEPERAAQLRQQAAQRVQQGRESQFGWDDAFTKVFLPAALGIATGVTGGLAAPAAAGVMGAVGAGLASGASGMAAGQAIGSGIDNIAQGNAGVGVAQTLGGVAKGVGGFMPEVAPVKTTPGDEAALDVNAALRGTRRPTSNASPFPTTFS